MEEKEIAKQLTKIANNLEEISCSLLFFKRLTIISITGYILYYVILFLFN